MIPQRHDQHITICKTVNLTTKIGNSSTTISITAKFNNYDLNSVEEFDNYSLNNVGHSNNYGRLATG